MSPETVLFWKMVSVSFRDRQYLPYVCQTWIRIKCPLCHLSLSLEMEDSGASSFGCTSC